jgi:valyl-tRNA synthetase
VGRQLWWGHRIPAWYCPDGHITVSDLPEGPDACADCGRAATELRQESDIFDTWFSSALWPFSTLGWPDETPDKARFYPTTLMETGYDILFFWVARMMMMGLFCTDTEPFETVYLHGMVRAQGGVKMSKTKGNVVDPLEIMEEIGADAMRYALVAGTSAGADQHLTRGKLDGARNFSNKLWNAARFVLSNRPEPMAVPSGEPSLAERWIASRQADVVARLTRSLDELDLGTYAGLAYDHAWSDVCDWFVEMVKVELRRPDATDGERARVWQATARGLADLLRLLHPIMPFITEAIWSALREAAPEATGDDDLLMTAAWPAPSGRDDAAEREFAAVADVIGAVRTARSEARIAAAAWLPLEIAASSDGTRDTAQANAAYISALARVRPLTIHSPAERASGREGDASQLQVPTALGAALLATGVGERSNGGSDSDAARHRQADVDRLQASIERVRQLLANDAFTAKAPEAVVARERERLADLEEQLRQLEG